MHGLQRLCRSHIGRRIKIRLQLGSQIAQTVILQLLRRGQLLSRIGPVAQHHRCIDTAAVCRHLQNEGIEPLARPIGGCRTGQIIGDLTMTL